VAADTSPNLAGTRVLLVEDEPLIALDAEDLLRGMGVADVACARSVAEGMSVLDAQTFHVALLDVRLGAESCLPLAERLAASNVPFGFMTGLRDDAIPEVFKDRPIIAKPFTRQHLANVLGALVARK
jgi:DNA-binding response OmpR family regulator